MSFLMCLRQIATSKAAKALFWILVAIGILLAIVIFLESISRAEEKLRTNSKLEISPEPSLGPTIHYNFRTPESINKITAKIHSFLYPYRTWKRAQTQCDFNSTIRNPGFTCKIELEKFGPCEKEDYGYSKATPCVFIKFNKVFGWIPEYFDIEGLKNTSLSSKYIEYVEEEVATKGSGILNRIWVECNGKTPFDSTLLGDIDYFPWRGFPGFLFPFKNETRYMEPLFAIYFRNPRPGILIDVECKFLARNFNESLTFALLVNG